MQNINISLSNIPNDITRYYLYFLDDQNLSSMRAVSNHFKEIIDKSSLYKFDARKLKERFAYRINLESALNLRGERELELKKELKDKFFFSSLFGF